MTTPGPSDRAADVADGAVEHVGRSRGTTTVAYVTATALGGLGALVVMVAELLSGHGVLLDVLLWAALAVLLLGAAARRWWLGGRNDERSRRIAAAIRPQEVAAAVDGSTGEIDAVRRLRASHHGLGLRDAYELYQRHTRDSH